MLPHRMAQLVLRLNLRALVKVAVIFYPAKSLPRISSGCGRLGTVTYRPFISGRSHRRQDSAASFRGGLKYMTFTNITAKET